MIRMRIAAEVKLPGCETLFVWRPWLLMLVVGWTEVCGQQPQNPSPMVEHTRSHPRLEDSSPDGLRAAFDRAQLFVPKALTARGQLPLVVHFHGATWLAEEAAALHGGVAVVSLQLGSGSSTYAKPFAADHQLFRELLSRANEAAETEWQSVTLSAWSAGYGAVREILKQPENYARVDGILLIDGLHTGYVHGKPGPLESELVSEPLDVFVRFARDATHDKKRMLITHSEIFPGTFASTTETADYLVAQLGLHRQAVLRWGPMGTQQLSEVRQGSLTIRGYAGNSAPDHVDQLHALPEFWREIVPAEGHKGK